MPCVLWPQGRIFMTHPTKAIYYSLLRDLAKGAKNSTEEALFNQAGHAAPCAHAYTCTVRLELLQPCNDSHVHVSRVVARAHVHVDTPTAVALPFRKGVVCCRFLLIAVTYSC